MIQRGATGINILNVTNGDIKELAHILNKQVKIKDIKGQEWIGNLFFIGTNPFFPSWGLHCTIDRMPGIRINSVNDITLLEELCS